MRLGRWLALGLGTVVGNAPEGRNRVCGVLPFVPFDVVRGRRSTRRPTAIPKRLGVVVLARGVLAALPGDRDCICVESVAPVSVASNS